MSTPNLSTFVRERVIREEQRMQTAFPAKVISYQAGPGTVTVEPQFIETHVTRSGERILEDSDSPYVENVPVCFPHYMSWNIDAGTFGLVICTKYSLDLWRSQLKRLDPGDLRRFTMSGATFHPVVIGESPSIARDFIALETKVRTALQKIQAAFDSHVHSTVTGLGTPTSPTAVPGQIPLSSDSGWDTQVGSSRVKVET